MIFWAAEGGPDPKIAEILDLGSEISYEGGGYFCKGGGGVFLLGYPLIFLMKIVS